MSRPTNFPARLFSAILAVALVGLFTVIASGKAIEPIDTSDGYVPPAPAPIATVAAPIVPAAASWQDDLVLAGVRLHRTSIAPPRFDVDRFRGATATWLGTGVPTAPSAVLQPDGPRISAPELDDVAELGPVELSVPGRRDDIAVR